MNGRPRGGVVMREAAPRPQAAGRVRWWAHDDDVEQALAAAMRDGERLTELLDELSRGRLWLPLPDDGGPVTDGSAIQLPTVVYLGAEFVPAYTSAERLAGHGHYGPATAGKEHGGALTAGPARGDDDSAPQPVPHVVVPAVELARRLPGGLGIALNPGAEVSVPIYPEGVAYLAAAESAAGGARIRVGRPPAEPESLLREVSAYLRSVPAARQAARTWLSIPGAGEGLVISVTLDDPVDEASQHAVITAVERAVRAAGPKASFPIDVTFPGEHEPDEVGRWISDHASPFYLRA
ncbi:MAG TPA: enhanced serine sensitivity protein SseB C-terminal domain-containing protein [Streptosporangiaceae bacterium]|nr:enhanced serine sensitivity protein SseB C-terminal domain-containing protein [Streptosporangiaceae bacterium]